MIPKPSKLEIRRAIAWGRQGQLEAAETLLRELVCQEPANLEAREALAKILAKQEKYPDAIALLKSMPASKTRDDEFLNLLGITCEKNGEYEEAARYYQAALILRPNAGETHYHLGNVYNHQGLSKQALQCYEMALYFQENLLDARYNMGNLYFRQGDLERACAIFLELLGRNPQDVEACLQLANICYLQKDYTQALHYYRKASFIQTRQAAIHFNMASIHELVGNQAEAADHYRQAIEFGAEESAYLKLASLCQNQGHYAQAIEICTRLLERFPDSIEGHYQLGLSYALTKELPQAAQELEKVLRQRPHSVNAYTNLGIVLINLGQYEEALRAFEQVQRINPRNFMTPFYMGVAYTYQERYAEAIQSFEKVLQYNSHHLSTFYHLGVVYANMGQYDQALDNFFYVLETGGENSDIYQKIGIIYLNKGNFKDAIREFQKAVGHTRDLHTYYYLTLAQMEVDQLDEAEASLELAQELAATPKEIADISILQGILAMTRQQFSQAEASYAQALKHTPANVRAFYNMACLHALQGHNREAMQWLFQAIEQDPLCIELAFNDQDFKGLQSEHDFQVLRDKFAPVEESRI